MWFWDLSEGTGPSYKAIVAQVNNMLAASTLMNFASCHFQTKTCEVSYSVFSLYLTYHIGILLASHGEFRASRCKPGRCRALSYVSVEQVLKRCSLPSLKSYFHDADFRMRLTHLFYFEPLKTASTSARYVQVHFLISTLAIPT